MATPLGKDALEEYKAKLVKSNSADLQAKYRKVFPSATDAEVTTLGRQGWIDQLLEKKRAELAMAIPVAAAPVLGTDPAMAQLIKMMVAQQQAFQQQLAADKAIAETRLAEEKAERKAALEREERRLAEDKAERKAALERESAERKAALERESAERKDALEREKLEKQAALEREERRW